MKQNESDCGWSDVRDIMGKSTFSTIFFLKKEIFLFNSQWIPKIIKLTEKDRTNYALIY